MTKRILSMILALLLVMSMVLTMAACNDETESTENDSAASAATSGTDSQEPEASQPSESKPGFSLPELSLPESIVSESGAPETSAPETSAPESEAPDSGSEVINFGGAKVNILGGSAKESYETYQIDADSPSDDPLIDAFYRRNKLISDTYGIDISVTIPNSNENILDLLRNDMQSGNNQYQAVVHGINYLAPFASDGLLTDFNNINNGYIQLDKAWWDKNIVKDLAINGKSYFLTGDAFVQDNASTWVMYFNKDLIDKQCLDNPYELVANGEWTVDKMYEMLQCVELTYGSSKSYDPKVGDQWGMVVQAYDFCQFMLGAEQRMVDNTKKEPALRIDSDENVATFEKIANWFIFDSKNVGVADYHGRWDSGVYEQEVQIFANGNALFMPHSLSMTSSEVMRNAKANFGIVPMPKGSKTQKNYASGINTYKFSVVAIPITNVGDTFDATCYALEAMAYFGKKLVTPEYYDMVLSHKSLKDDNSVKMLDIILANRIYDMGSAFNFNGGNEVNGTLYFYTNLLGEKSNNIMSMYSMYKESYQAGIDALIAQCY